MSSTILDIARIAQVSKSTVSRVINNSGYVSKEARDKVEKAIKKIDFVPSAVAQGLSKRFNSTIGIVIPELNNDFFMEILEGVNKIADENNMNIILSYTSNNIEKQKKALNMVKSQRVSGLLITPAEDSLNKEDSVLLNKQLESLNIPIVIIDRKIPEAKYSGIYFENEKASYIATKELIINGNKSIGCITGDLNLNIAKERFAGFERAMNEFNLPIKEKYIIRSDFTMETTYMLVNKKIKNNKLPDAFFSSNNETSLGLIKALKKNNVKIGKDIAAIGIDKVKCFDILGLKFSHIARNPIEIGIDAMNIIIEEQNNPKIDKQIKYNSGELILEGSEKR